MEAPIQLKKLMSREVYYSSRIGKEEKVAMEMAIEEFNSQYSNQHIDLLINDSQGEPIQAALAGKSISSSPLISGK